MAAEFKCEIQAGVEGGRNSFYIKEWKMIGGRNSSDAHLVFRVSMFWLPQKVCLSVSKSDYLKPRKAIIN